MNVKTVRDAFGSTNLVYRFRRIVMVSDQVFRHRSGPEVALGEASQPGDGGGIVISAKSVSGGAPLSKDLRLGGDTLHWAAPMRRRGPIPSASSVEAL